MRATTRVMRKTMASLLVGGLRLRLPTLRACDCGLICLPASANPVHVVRQICATGKSPQNLSSPSRKNIPLNLQAKSAA
jgi:hypothetical protein